MIDLDFFKRINDTYGHRAGDQALRSIGAILSENCRGSDIIGRYGGEEFCVLLPETCEEAAVLWADRVREQIAARTDLVDNIDSAITASFGVAQRLADTSSPEELVDLADQALLVAKRSGRDRVVGFQNMSTNSCIQASNGLGAIFEGLVAKNVMATIVASLNQDETVGHAVRYFLRFRFHSAPVVNEHGKLVGILSERDVMSTMLWPRWYATEIKDVMKQNVVCYDEDTPVLMIYEFLCRVSIRGVVIVKDGQPTGLLSRGSLLRWFTNMLAVSPNAVSESPVLEDDDSSEGAVLPPDPRENVAMIARALADETSNLERRIRRERADLIPVVVGGVSRLEELLNDLMAFSRYANVATKENADSGRKCHSEHGTVRGLAEFAAGEFPSQQPGDTDALFPTN